MLKNKSVLAFGLLGMAIRIVYHLHELDLNVRETFILHTLCPRPYGMLRPQKTFYLIASINLLWVHIRAYNYDQLS
jgi:hypothetical protein